MPDSVIDQMNSFINDKELHQRLMINLVRDECISNPEKRLKLIEILTSDITFFKLLEKYMHQLNIKEKDFRNRACISDALFHNMIDKNYRSSKKTVFKSLIGLSLGYMDSSACLEKAGYAFNWNNNTDLVIIFCIINKIYKAMEIDELLDAAGEPCIFNSTN